VALVNRSTIEEKLPMAIVIAHFWNSELDLHARASITATAFARGPALSEPMKCVQLASMVFRERMGERLTRIPEQSQEASKAPG
jgi:hypothetical protein